MSAPHLAYVVASYVVSGIGIAALVIDTVLRARHWRARADDKPSRDAPR